MKLLQYFKDLFISKPKPLESTFGLPNSLLKYNDIENILQIAIINEFTRLGYEWIPTVKCVTDTTINEKYLTVMFEYRHKKYKFEYNNAAYFVITTMPSGNMYLDINKSALIINQIDSKLRHWYPNVTTEQLVVLREPMYEKESIYSDILKILMDNVLFVYNRLIHTTFKDIHTSIPYSNIYMDIPHNQYITSSMVKTGGFVQAGNLSIEL